MKTYSATTAIRATPEAIWKILTDAAGYPSWDHSYTSIEGQIALGETITLHHRDMKPQVLPMTVTVFEPQQRMVWTGGGMPEAVFKGERVFALSAPNGSGGAAEVEFTVQLVFSGLMAAVITKSIPDMQPHLDEFAAALKKRAEQP
jgi:hypothetical protein